MQIEIWADVVCPWCYLGKRRLEAALALVDFGSEVQVAHRSFQLDPDAPRDRTVETSAMLASKYHLSEGRVEEVQRQMEERAAADGLEYHFAGQRVGNTLDAHRLLHLAKVQGRQHELLERLYRAYFTEGRSLFEPASLTALAVDAGVSGEEAADVLSGARYADAVEADLAEARELGISGVPFFVVDRRLAVSGAQPVEVLRDALQQAAAAA